MIKHSGRYCSLRLIECARLAARSLSQPLPKPCRTTGSCSCPVAAADLPGQMQPRRLLARSQSSPLVLNKLRSGVGEAGQCPMGGGNEVANGNIEMLNRSIEILNNNGSEDE